MNIEKTSKTAAAITCATALGGSDRSMGKKKASGWSIEIREGNRCYISGAGMVDGAQSTNDPNRAK